MLQAGQSSGRRRSLRLRLGLLAGLAILVASTVGGVAARATALGPSGGTHATTATPIQHVVIIMEENHSFDDYFGTFPGLQPGYGIPSGVCVPDPRTKGCDAPYHNTTGFSHDIPHWSQSSVADVNNGKMDGFVAQEQQACNCALHESMSYFDAREIPVFWRYAENYTLHDNLFEPVASWSWPSHLSLVSEWSASCKSQTDPFSCTGRLNIGQPTRTTWPATTLPWTDLTWLLHQNGTSWGYYVADGTEPDCASSGCVMGPQSAATPAIFNPLPWFEDVQNDGQLGNIKELSSFYTDISSGNLPAVSWVVPTQAVSGHPGTGNQLNSEPYVVSLINAIESSSAWSSTAILLTWDDWGGQYDHIKPPTVDGLGFGLRVPSILISPYAKKGYIDNQTLSFDAYNKFIEDDFLGGQRLDPKTDQRPDSRTTVRENNPLLGNLVSDFDFSKPPSAPILFPTVTVPATIARGTQISVSGAYYKPGDTVHVVLNCGTPDCAGGVVAGSALVAADGSFTATVTVPPSLGTGNQFASAEGSDPLTYFALTNTAVH